MQALARRGAAGRAAPQWPAAASVATRRVARASYSSGGGDASSASSPTPNSAQVGSRVEPWLSSPLGALAFGPRAALGALLTLPSRLEGLPADLQRAGELLADPRPLGDKQAAVAAEVEARLVAALEAGARVEQEALGAVRAALPADAARAVDELLLQPLRPPVGSGGGYYSSSSSSAGAYSPDWMTSTEEVGGSSTSSGAWSDGGGGASFPQQQQPRPPPTRYERMYGAANAARPAPTVTYTADMVAPRLVASELAGVRSAVAGLKAALEGLRAGSQGQDAGARAGMLRLNVQEARGVLAARLEEVGPPPAVGGGGQDAATLAAAVREARMLLNEVDGQFGF